MLVSRSGIPQMDTYPDESPGEQLVTGKWDSNYIRFPSYSDRSKGRRDRDPKKLTSGFGLVGTRNWCREEWISRETAKSTVNAPIVCQHIMSIRGMLRTSRSTRTKKQQKSEIDESRRVRTCADCSTADIRSEEDLNTAP